VSAHWRLSTSSVLTKRTPVNTYCDGVIDFSNGSVFKLSAIHPQEIGPAVAPLMIQGEQIVACFKAVRDFVVFTNKRLIAVNVQGMTGKKRDFTSLPYSKVQAFSVETAGTFDLDAELDLWFSGLGKVRLEFKGNADIRQLGQMIATYVL
jgi:hypothetical protein